MTRLLVILAITISSMLYAQKTEFSKEALSSTFLNTSEKEVSLSEILANHKGKTVLIEIWASWCSDCVAAMPKIKEIQEKFSDIDYVFISMDKTFNAWIEGIEKHNIVGDHYFSDIPWKESEFAKSIDLDWIPRYMVVNSKGEISLFKAVKPNDKNLIKAISIENNGKSNGGLRAKK